jgi:lysyl-tRNA synthetase, class II
MEYGMPCQSGWGMGIDRIVSLLTEQENLRDVVLFPIMKSEKDEKQTQETNLAVCVLNTSTKMEKWQELNTIAHLNAAYGARNGKTLFDMQEVTTKDNKKISLNTSHAIMIKQSDTLTDILQSARENNLHVAEFTREMLESSDDKKVSANTNQKNYDDVEYLGILIYGKKKEVERVTKELGLYS